MLRSCLRAASIMPPASANTSKTYLVTGATDGIGKHTAERLANIGATVLVHGRTPEKAQKAVQEVKSASGNPHVKPLSADLSSLDAVRGLADDVKAAAPNGVDVLINNAGVFAERPQKSADGYENTWAVNVLAPVLLTSLLQDSVKDRIVNVSSISAGNDIDFNNLNQEKGFDSHDAYSLSKLAIMMFNKELADRLQKAGSSVTANSLEPGDVNTKLLDTGWGMCGIPIEDANNEFLLATDPSVADTSGGYFVNSRKSSMRRPAQDAEQRRKLWDTLQEQTGAKWSI